METKKCSKCDNILELISFSKFKYSKDGYSAWCKLCNKVYKELNKNKIKEHRKEYRKKYQIIRKKRYRDDLEFRLNNVLRSRLHNAINSFRFKKADRMINLLGCSVVELKSYIESLFEPEMTWDNYGYYGWHIDHIRPCASFNLTDPEQQKLCFHYTNLQPLWHKDNLSKGKK